MTSLPASTKSLARTAKDLAKAALRPLANLGAPERSPLPLAHWGLTSVDAHGLALEGHALHELAARHGSPLHVVDVRKLRANAAAFLHHPEGARGGCEVFYSYKTNPVPGVLRVLHESGIGAEVISAYELWLALRLGVAPDRIVYNGPYKGDDSIRDALRRGIGLLNFNHREEIRGVARLAAEVGVRARVGVRVTTGEGWTGQFGVPIAGGAALETCRAVLAEPSLELVGIHAHRGIAIRSAAHVDAHVNAVLAFVDTLHTALGFTPQILDLGGSLGTPTVAPIDRLDARLNRTLGRSLPPPSVSDALRIEPYVERVVALVEAHFAARSLPRPRIFLEPGRAMTGNTQALVATVRALNTSGERTFAILDAGINVAETVRDNFHQIFPVNRHAQPNARRYTLVGPICTPGDLLCPSVDLPELDVGDTLVIMDSGAYFVPFATSFSFPQPAIVAVDGEHEYVMRRAETFEDLIVGDHL